MTIQTILGGTVMTWNGEDLSKLITASAAIVAAAGWLAKSLITHWLRSQAQQHLENVKAALAHVERLESDLMRGRGEAYGEIWRLTGCVNLFGPVTPIAPTELSSRLSSWYFERGWLLTGESKNRYFLIQEVLNFFILRSVVFSRPSGEELFGAENHTVPALREIRVAELKISRLDDDGLYSVEELEVCVSNWKSRCPPSQPGSVSPEQAWVLLQFVMSAFRTWLAKELHSRDIPRQPMNVAANRFRTAKTSA
jgi:hypothetical protein